MQRLIGSIFAAPSELFFLSTWTVASLFRPLVLVTFICLLANPTAAYRKFLLFVSTIQYLVLCNDKKWKEPAEDPASYFPKDATISSKTIIFVRHGESTWNDTFNKGDRSVLDFILNFVPNLLYAVATEWYFWVAGQANDSWFFDAPLSDKGRRQAESVRTYLQQQHSNLQYLPPKEQKLVQLLRGELPAKIVSSNLRRAIATVALGFRDRLTATTGADESILLLPELQEISRNPDALSITPPYQPVVPASVDPPTLTRIYTHQVDTSRHTGNKPVQSNGLVRMQTFCTNVWSVVPEDTVIVGGHSLWFRSFFRTYLPRSSTHTAKRKKIVNGGIVAFTLQRVGDDDKKAHYMIDPASIVVLHGGF